MCSVLCRSLEELQKRNEELLTVVRELSSQNEKMEEEMSNERYCICVDGCRARIFYLGD